MFLLDVLDNIPHLPVSDSLMKVIIWILKETGTSEVPLFTQLRKVQSNLCQSCEVPTVKCHSPQGNIFYMNDVCHLIAQNWANPMVRPHIQVYSEIPDGPISEVWHGQKWRSDMDLDLLSPMYNTGGRHFYVKELTQMRDGSYIIPICWVTYRKRTHACSEVETKCIWNSCWRRLRGRLRWVTYALRCLFHAFDRLPETSSQK